MRQSVEVEPMRTPTSSFSGALRSARVARGLPQEAFDGVSSRNYVSCLERGLKQPTISKVDELSAVLKVHPLTLLALAYLGQPGQPDLNGLLDRVRAEVLLVQSAEVDVRAPAIPLGTDARVGPSVTAAVARSGSKRSGKTRRER